MQQHRTGTSSNTPIIDTHHRELGENFDMDKAIADNPIMKAGYENGLRYAAKLKREFYASKVVK